MQRTKVKCELCGQEISKSNLSKHLRRHQQHPESFKDESYKLTHDGLDCQFCGKTCKNRNSLCNHERLCKENPNKQLVVIEGFNDKGRVAWNKGLTKEIDTRVSNQSKSLRNYYETHSGVWSGHKHTDEEKLKIGAGVKAFLVKNPDMVPYIRNHSSNQSYPEKYFKELFKAEGLDLSYHHRIHTYELDFCNVDKKLDIEIDGEQHYLDSRVVESDKKRNQYLQSLGWNVFRIRWAEFKKYSGAEKIELINTIKNLLH